MVKKHKPNDETRRDVHRLAFEGNTQLSIASILEIHPETLRKYYRQELDIARNKNKELFIDSLTKKAKQGDTKAMIYLLEKYKRYENKSAAATQKKVHKTHDGRMLSKEQYKQYLIKRTRQ